MNILDKNNEDCNLDILPEFENISLLHWLFTYNDDTQKIYVYKVNIINRPYIYAKIFLPPIFNNYTIQLFTYSNKVL